jgi:hypothetical protein
MKSLEQFKSVLTEEEKQDYQKFDTLVRAGLANKAQIQRLHKILDKMGEERPMFNNQDRQIMQNLFNKMVDLITNNKQIFTQTRKAVREEVEEITEAPNVDTPTPPFVLVLRRKAIRMYPEGTRVALYYNERLNRYFSVPYSSQYLDRAPIQAEETQVDPMLQLQDGMVVHLDGTVSEVDEQTVNSIMTVYKSLNEDNKSKLANMIGESKEQLQRAADFSFKHLK